MGILLQGKSIAQEIHKLTSQDINQIKEQYGVEPSIAIVAVGKDDPLKNSEVKLHSELAMQLGINVKEELLDELTEESQLINVIQKLNIDNSIQGIMVLLPLPEHIDSDKVLSSIAYSKELEGLNEQKDIKTLYLGKQISVISAILTMLKNINIDLFNSKNVLLIEDSILNTNAVIKRLIKLASYLKIPLEIAETGNSNCKKITNQADLLFVSVETPELVNAFHIKEGSVVIDFNPILVGKKYSEEKKKIVPILKSGLNVDSLLNKAAYVAPSLGGIGPIALAILMRNFVHNCKEFFAISYNKKALFT